GEDTLASLPLAASGSWPDRSEWRFEDEATGVELHAQPLDAGRQRTLGLPATGPGWELVLPHARRGRLAVRARLQQPWSGRGAVPLIVLPVRFHTRGTVVIEVVRSIRSSATATGLRTLDPDVAAFATTGDDGDADSIDYRRAHAFGYSSAGAALDL